MSNGKPAAAADVLVSETPSARRDCRAGLIALGLLAAVLVTFGPLLHSTVTVDTTSDRHFGGALPVVEPPPAAWSPVAGAVETALSGWSARAQHLLSIAVHAFNTVLVFSLALRLFAGARTEVVRTPWHVQLAALAAALVFGLHPQRVEALGWTDQLPLLLSAGLLLAAVLAYLHAATHTAMFVACLGALALSPLGLALPVLLLLLDFWPLRRWSRAPGRLLLAKLGLVLLGVGAVLWSAGKTEFDGARWYGPARSVLIAAHDAVQYVCDLLIPLHLAPGREAPTPLQAATWPYLAGCTGVSLVLLAAVVFARRTPPLVVAVGAYLVALAPAALLWRVPEAAADRYSYLPAVVLGLGCGAVLIAIFQRPGAEARGVAWAATALLLVAGGTLGWLAQRQAAVWATPLRLWEHALECRPDSALAAVRLGRLAEARGELERAGQLYYVATRYRPEWAAAYLGLAEVQLQAGQPGKAAQTYARALRLQPERARLHYEYAVALAAADQAAVAEEHLRRAVALAPAAAAPRLGLARLLRGLGRAAEADGELDETYRQFPRDPHVQREVAFRRAEPGHAAPAAD